LKSAGLQYANALADVALAEGQIARVLQQFADFLAAYRVSAELRNLLASPAVGKAEKRRVAETLSARLGAGKIVRNFLFVVIDHQRTPLLPEIFECFEKVVREREGVAEAEVFSPSPLDEGQKRDMTRALEQLTGKKVEAKFSIDPKLLGGAAVRVGDTIYDGSLRNRLRELRERLAAE
jgi:F-type H+-transporting ATPase subunit delta